MTYALEAGQKEALNPIRAAYNTNLVYHHPKRSLRAGPTGMGGGLDPLSRWLGLVHVSHGLVADPA